MQETENKLPILLKVALIFSFIGSSFLMFSGLQDALSTPTQERLDSFKEIFENVKDETPEGQQMIQDSYVFMEQINLNIVNYGATRFMLYAISLIGVYLMYRLKKTGFLVYSIAQVLLLSLPVLFGGYNGFSLGVTFVFSFLTMIFIIIYASQLKYMD
jgi:hypothetical protein